MRKSTTDSKLQIDIREIMRMLKRSIDGKVLYRWNSSREDMPIATVLSMASSTTMSIEHVSVVNAIPNEIVDITYSKCHLGGIRAWFLCNRIGCCRKVAVLYDTPKGFRCRHCANLIHRSSRERSYDRLLRRVRAVRAKAGGEHNLFKPFPERPKGMHTLTYLRLLEQEAALWGVVGEKAKKRLGKQVVEPALPRTD